MTSINSMTAFARSQTSTECSQWTWELRSVNHRFLELQFKLPENHRHLEPALRKQLKTKLSRGKIDISLQFFTRQQNEQLNINHSAARTLLSAITELHTLSGIPPLPLSISATELLAWPGILEKSTAEPEEINRQDNALLNSFASTLETLIQERRREGKALADTLYHRLPELRRIVETIRQNVPEIMAHQKAKLLQRIQDAGCNLQPERLEQEVVLYAQKLDVAEEIDRLLTHATEVESILAKGGHVGRRLDFLMQELHREANTIGAKSAQVITTQASIDLKVLIEQMREQIQNIE